ncbi:type IV pilin protein [Spirilliplanes yamanashiensis]|uniref:Prepilin-type N-terminal cleavage/methylation domain-containing protein n=1 Tax=Spirilliplanes yamanashiensis TaxID=42233 RepID=A0A8J4DM22_9ACTN|nr:prepilin-type N-terminal cleavage/methylation domain-containing protein [Spirilliplanes yamanashiensis]MDP9816175.1 type IV pilus assembly protein PilA [Spirilliplanes yamanashiensis]GIJ05700.1 hypothetical protein Sya03_50520 [Spirilliplanes yamanashiensis]
MRRTIRDEGFTLIELLVVVVIIGILVAIAVPVYQRYSRNAWEKSVVSDIRGAITAVEQFRADHNAYPNTASLQPDDFFLEQYPSGPATTTKVTLSDSVMLTIWVNWPAGTSYRICARNAAGGYRRFLYDSVEGGSIRVRTVTNASVCAYTP